MKNLQSTLTKAYPEFCTINNLEEAKRFISIHISTTKIKEEDKKRMLSQIENSSSLPRLQTYITNSLLKYEGLGVSRFRPKNK